MKGMIPGTKKSMRNSEFWVNKVQRAENIIMLPNKIISYNEVMLNKASSLHRILEYKDKIAKGELIDIIEKYKIPEDVRYDDLGRTIDNGFYEGVITNTNIMGIKDINEVAFGITINSTRIRSFPTNCGNFKSKDDREFDRFQETESLGIEAVAILHISLDGEWFFIQMYNYNGWVKAQDIAVSKSKIEISEYIESKNFLMVIGNRIQTQFNHYDSRISKKDFYMGTKIPLETDYNGEIGNQASIQNYVVKLPVRDYEGNLEFQRAFIAIKEDVNVGYLPYTEKNILEQAFKLQGDRYDWGNKNNGRDCSSFVMYVYKTFGIILPRNVNEQEICLGTSHKFVEKMTIAKRKKVFHGTILGALIFMEGHVMMYIGEDKDEYFMIHDFHSCGVISENHVLPINVNQVAVTPIKLLTSSGKSYIEAFSSLLEIK